MLALFDMDGTLIPWDSQLRFFHYVVSRFPEQRRYLGKYLRKALLYVLFRKGSEEELKRLFLGYLEGIDLAELEKLAKDFAREILLPLVYPEVKAKLDLHLKRKDRCLLVSASPEIYVKEVGNLLGFDGVYGTEVEWQDGKIFLPSGNNKGANKIKRLEAELAKFPQQDDRIGYTDSLADLPMMEVCGHGVVVNPKKKLIEIARQRGWEILRPSYPQNAQPPTLRHLFQLLRGDVHEKILIGKRSADSERD